MSRLTAELEYSESMRSEQRPDVYSGKNFDDYRPRWVGGVEKEGEVEVGDHDGRLVLDPRHFTPGTRVIVMVPHCPECDLPNDYDGADAFSPCFCGFSWREWAGNTYS